MFDEIIINSSFVIAMIAGIESTANTISKDSIKRKVGEKHFKEMNGTAIYRMAKTIWKESKPKSWLKGDRNATSNVG